MLCPGTYTFHTHTHAHGHSLTWASTERRSIDSTATETVAPVIYLVGYGHFRTHEVYLGNDPTCSCVCCYGDGVFSQETIT